MAFTRLQSTSGKDVTFASSCFTTAFGSPLTPGSIILVAVEFDTGLTNSVNSVTDTAGNTYTRILSKNEAGVFNLEMWYAINITTTSSNIVHATDTSGGVDSVICAEEWTGESSSPIDVSVSANDGGAPSTALNSGTTATTSKVNELIWCAGAVAGSANTLTAGAGFSNVTQNSTTFSTLGIESKTVSALGTQSGTFTANTSGSWCCGVVTISIATATFLEPGGDADFLVGTTNGFWSTNSGAVAVSTAVVHGTHVNSLKYLTSSVTRLAVCADAGTRLSLYINITTLPSAVSGSAIIKVFTGLNTSFVVTLLPNGTLQINDDGGAIRGASGFTLSTGTWYRISLAYVIKSTTVNRFELFINGVSSISLTNAVLSNIAKTSISIGNLTGDASLVYYSSDHYIDNSPSLTDTGDIWVTAKRPFTNGTTNGFTTQIGAGGSGYGTGHSPQVNERPLSTTNGWSMVVVGSAVTEEYNIENKLTGDIAILDYSTIVDYLGWVSCSSLTGETINVIVNGINFSQAITSTTTLYTKIAGSGVYPSGTGADIGIQTATTATTVSLYESGMLIAFIPGVSIAWWKA